MNFCQSLSAFCSLRRICSVGSWKFLAIRPGPCRARIARRGQDWPRLVPCLYCCLASLGGRPSQHLPNHHFVEDAAKRPNVDAGGQSAEGAARAPSATGRQQRKTASKYSQVVLASQILEPPTGHGPQKTKTTRACGRTAGTVRPRPLHGRFGQSLAARVAGLNHQPWVWPTRPQS